MIVVYALPLSTLPSAAELLASLPHAWRLSWEAQHARLRRAEQQRASLGCLALLARCAPDGTPAYRPSGQPYFTDIPVTFSLSHSRRLAVCAVCRADEAGAAPFPIGVDTEELSRVSEMDYTALCRRYATENERRVYLPAPSPEQFLRFWTRKEALLKQMGTGLSGLSDADTEDASRNVQFAEYRAGDDLISLCLPKGATPPPSLSQMC